MNCPNCHFDLPEGCVSCPHCGQAVIRTNAVVDAELVQDNYDAGKSHGQGAFYRKFVYITPQNSALLSPLPTGMITFALAVAMGLQYGFLAFIGFLFFYGLTWIASFVLRMQLLFKGRFLPPLLVQCCSWAICWLIVSKLAV
ncbi:MAG: hypothetical protein J6I40_06325 [Mailhella sp.]|nr:hypothetical protein [Mailhella sp.]